MLDCVDDPDAVGATVEAVVGLILQEGEDLPPSRVPSSMMVMHSQVTLG